MQVVNPSGGSGGSPNSTYEFQIGNWKLSNVAATATTSMGLFGAATADNSVIADRAGQIVGISLDMEGNIVSGTATFQIVVGGVVFTAAGQFLAMPDGADVRIANFRLTTPIPYGAKQTINVRVVSAALNPTTLDPIVFLRCQEVFLGPTTLASFFVNGTADMESVWSPYTDTVNYVDAFPLWKFETANGVCSLTWDGQAANTFTLTINGVAVLTTTTDVNQWPVEQNWTATDVMRIRCYITPTTARVRIADNAAVGKDKTAVGAWTLVTPTSGVIYPTAPITNYTDHSAMAQDCQCNGVEIGDSTTGIINRLVSIGSQVYTPTEAATGKRIAIIATAGNTINQQLTKWQASRYRGDAAVRWVTVSVGLNDCAAGNSTAVVTADLVTLLTDIRTNNPLAKIVLKYMTPADAWASFNAAKQAVWLAVNKNMDGSGGTPISPTLYDAQEVDWSNAMNTNLALGVAGTNTLAAGFNSGDGVHENAAGRVLGGADERAVLVSLGVL